MVQAYWHIGKLIVDAQDGKERAAYGDNLLKSLSTRLSQEFGKGFDTSNLRNMRTFYLTFPNYERLLSTHRDSSEVKDLIKKNLPTRPEKFDPLTLVHDPFILEFIGAKEDVVWREIVKSELIL